MNSESQRLLKTKRDKGQMEFARLLQLLKGAAALDQEQDTLFSRQKRVFLSTFAAGIFGIVSSMVLVSEAIPGVVFSMLALLFLALALGAAWFCWKRVKEGGAWRFPAFLMVVFLLFGLGFGWAWRAVDLWGPSMLFLWLGVFLAIGGALGFAIAYIRWKRRDIINDFRNTVVPFLEYVEEDISPQAQVEYSLDLAGPVKAKIAKSWRDKVRTRSYGFTLYEDPWFNMAVRLKDGNLMELSCVNLWQKRVRRGGKRKVKWKKVSLITAAITVRNDAMKWDEAKVARKAAQGKVKFRPGKKGGRLSLTRKFKFKRLTELPQKSPSPKQVAGMFMEIYKLSSVVQEKGNG